MNIAFIIEPNVLISGRSNGVRMQAIDWKNALVEKGHTVDLVNPWEHHNWPTYDVLHFFGSGAWLEIIEELRKKNPNIVISPIFDSLKSPFLYKIASHTQIPLLRMYSPNAAYRNMSKYIKCHFARSNYESNLIRAAAKNPNISVVPLSPRILETPDDLSQKEDYVFHVSSFTQSRKNVMRLMQASVKYNFHLVIAGNKGTDDSFLPFKNYASNHSNIEILGFLSEEELENRYKRAKVFALPSVREGVGLVALEAAIKSCGIVITKIGGPKEYYGEYGHIVDPYDIDSIGQGVVNALKNPHQPQLKNHILELYNPSRCADLIIDTYQSISK